MLTRDAVAAAAVKRIEAEVDANAEAIAAAVVGDLRLFVSVSFRAHMLAAVIRKLNAVQRELDRASEGELP
jgi:hypothetical protein